MTRQEKTIFNIIGLKRHAKEAVKILAYLESRTELQD